MSDHHSTGATGGVRQLLRFEALLLLTAAAAGLRASGVRPGRFSQHFFSHPI